MLMWASQVMQMVRNPLLTWETQDVGLIPGSGRSLGGGPGSPLQYSYLGNLMDRGAWQASPQGITRVGYNLLIKLPLQPIPLR